MEWMGVLKSCRNVPALTSGTGGIKSGVREAIPSKRHAPTNSSSQTYRLCLEPKPGHPPWNYLRQAKYF